MSTSVGFWMNSVSIERILYMEFYLQKLLIFWQKLSMKIKSRLNFSTFWPVFRYCLSKTMVFTNNVNICTYLKCRTVKSRFDFHWYFLLQYQKFLWQKLNAKNSLKTGQKSTKINSVYSFILNTVQSYYTQLLFLSMVKNTCTL